MGDKKIVVVFGATGRQGGSVAKALTSLPDFQVRAVTQKPNSKGACYLKDIGVEIVTGDLNDLSSLKPVLKGVYGCFLVTDFWEHCSKGTELKHGENVINLAKIYGLKHLVFSGLESTWDECGLKCDHFEGKSRIEKYLLQVKVPHTVIRLSEFMENFLDCYPPQRQPDGRCALQVPVGESQVPLIPATEIGRCVSNIFTSGDQYINKTIGLASDCLTIKECAEMLSSELKPVTFFDSQITRQEYTIKNDFGNVEDLVNMFEFIEKGQMVRDITLTRTLDPNISDFKTWVKRHKEKLLHAIVDDETSKTD